MNALLEVRNFCVSHESTEVVHNVSFDISRSQVSAILGVNGAGKSSLVGGLLGLLRSSGSITFDGMRIETMSAWTRAHQGIALVQEGRRLFHGLTVAENLGLASWRRNKTNAQVSAQRNFVHDLFPVLKRKAADPASRLSGGEQQMLAVAQGLMTFPKLLILDEPTAGLAPKIVSQMLEAIQRLASEGYSTLVIEQSIANVRRVAKEVMMMKVGSMPRKLEVSELDATIEAEYLK